jgi:hypothetical protein
LSSRIRAIGLHLEQAANRRRLLEDLVPQSHADLRKSN